MSIVVADTAVGVLVVVVVVIVLVAAHHDTIASASAVTPYSACASSTPAPTCATAVFGHVVESVLVVRVGERGAHELIVAARRIAARSAHHSTSLAASVHVRDTAAVGKVADRFGPGERARLIGGHARLHVHLAARSQATHVVARRTRGHHRHAVTDRRTILHTKSNQ